METLTWGLVIATYQRAHILPRCLRLAAEQTRPPKEIIVVDASPDWQTTRQQVRQELAPYWSTIPLTYVQGRQASATIQRNQGIDLATADVLFLIDDDSLMYPDCAEHIMQVYEADRTQAIQGVSAIHVPTPPEDLSAPESRLVARPPQQTWLRRLAKRLLNTEGSFFLPYDRVAPIHPLPAHLSQQPIAPIQVMAGYAMTFRRQIFQQERFSEVLERYTCGDDQDLSYRVSRHGALVNALEARLCHLAIAGGRLSPYQVAILAALNPAVLQQFYSSHRAYTNRRWRKILQHRIVINLIKEWVDHDWSFSRTRGNWFALGQLRRIYRQSPADLQVWYPQFQQQIIAGHDRPHDRRPSLPPSVVPAIGGSKPQK